MWWVGEPQGEDAGAIIQDFTIRSVGLNDVENGGIEALNLETFQWEP